ncbi:hypothetical protein FGF1_32250 [Flavobacteriaceae bacterium GF1]
MMDELELLKKDWQKQGEQLPKLSYEEIYKMIWKKSSSLVKWIFYISIAEFVFWISLFFLPIQGEKLNSDGARLFQNLELSLEILRYIALVYFIVKFYKNFKRIHVTASARELMKSIISTRKTVMQYVWFNLGVFALMMIVVFIEFAKYDTTLNMTEKIAEADNSLLIWFLVGLSLLLFIAFCGFLLWLFYRLLYGILLKRLNNNYRELKKLEV